MAEIMKRQTAIKVLIGEILNGQFIKEDSDIPNHVLSQTGQKLGRVNVLGTIVDVDDSAGYPSIVIDDGTGAILVRAFEPLPTLAASNIGDVVLVIGRPREFNHEMYILPEIVKVIIDPVWIQVRRKEFMSVETHLPAEEPAQVSTPAPSAKLTEEIIVEEDSLVALIRKIDDGDGADYEQVIAESGQENAETKIQKFISQGKLFEPRPGRLKVLD